MTKQNRKLGKQPARHDPRTLNLAKYLVGDFRLSEALPPPPAHCSYQEKITNGPGWPMMLNDELGDCTVACAGHMIQQWTAYAGKSFVPSDDEILSAYEAVGGYVPGNPDTDNGAVILDVLNFWRKTGIGGHKILAYVQVNPLLEDEVKTALQLFGNVYLGVQLPVSAQTTDYWAAASGPDGQPGSWGGHAIPLVDYDKEYYVITWGERLMMTPTFLKNYCDEAYAVLSQIGLTSGSIGALPDSTCHSCRRICNSLLDNAVDHTTERRTSVMITVSWWESFILQAAVSFLTALQTKITNPTELAGLQAVIVFLQKLLSGNVSTV